MELDIGPQATPPAGIALLDGATLQDFDFRRATFELVSSSGCVFWGCDFRETVLDRRHQPLFSGRRQSVFRECRFDGADLRAVQPGQARFERCVFDGANLEGWTAYCAEFVGCHFAGRLKGAKFYGRPWGPLATTLDPLRDVNEFSGNDFSEARPVGTVFVRGVNVRAQRWPDAAEYVLLDAIQQRMTRGREEILRWRDSRARQHALDLLQATAVLYGQQRDVFVRVGEVLPSVPADVERRVWETLCEVLASPYPPAR